jgi:fatty acid-binding protein DegV
MLTVREGEIHPARQVRTRSKALDALVEWTQQHGAVEAIGVGYSTDEADARSIISRLKESGSSTDTDIVVTQIGPVIGAYAGPGCVGVAVLAK